MAKGKKRKPGHVPGKPPGMSLSETRKWERETFEKLVQEAANRKFKHYQRSLTQMCIDAAFMANNDEFHMGPTRCEGFGQAMVGYINEMAGMIVQDAKDDEDFVYTKTKVDQRLKQICGDKFQPWEERYKDGT